MPSDNNLLRDMESSLFVVLMFAVCAIPVQSQFGKDCSERVACRIHQTCYVGYCVCDLGYVKVSSSPNCFPAVRKYGQRCFHDEQCIDHRMTCQPENDTDPSLTFCFCDKFHVWNEGADQCVQKHNISFILSTLSGSNHTEHIMQEANSIFVWIIWAGLGVAVVFGLVAVACVVYGCCLYECFDMCVKEPEVSSRCPPTCVNYQRDRLERVT